MQRGCVQHHLAAVLKRQFQQATGAVGVDVHHVLIQPLVDLRLHGIQNPGGELVILRIRKRKGRHEWLAEAVGQR
jgi:hypothetical protein